jgi:FtsP/CotA-like multicopper oxidase with cupredoxin domain
MNRLKKEIRNIGLLTLFAAAMLLTISAGNSKAAVDGDYGPIFNLTARADHLASGDGGSVYFWGYSLDGRRTQYPGPTFIVNQGDEITVNLTNALPAALGVSVSIVFPGQQGVTAAMTSGAGKDGLLTKEAGFGETVQYKFTAGQPGTYLYHSGTSPELQVEMGLVGAVIVRPYMGQNHAYNHADSRFDREYLFLLSEMDPRIHRAIEFQGMAGLNPEWFSDYFSGWWFINGRNGPDTMLGSNVMELPTQPYNAMPITHPGDKLLMRIINAGRELHPFHHHGNHARVIARDGRLLDTGSGNPMIDLSYLEFTVQAVPGETTDSIFEWTSTGLGWDIYGDANDPDFAHLCNGSNSPSNTIDPVTGEDCNFHNNPDRPFPVVLPGVQSLTFGGFWIGSPFLGSFGSLPPGEGGLNTYAGLAFMWHSHTEKELTNFDIFPGGMMTMLIVAPPGAPID